MFFGISSLGILFINVGCVEHAKIKMNAAYQCLDKINNKRLISLDSFGHHELLVLSVSRTVFYKIRVSSFIICAS
jgi:hypothetical protein